MTEHPKEKTMVESWRAVRKRVNLNPLYTTSRKASQTRIPELVTLISFSVCEQVTKF
jgi:hypothetical protein